MLTTFMSGGSDQRLCSACIVVACSLVAVESVEPSEHKKVHPMTCLYSAMARSRPTAQHKMKCV